MNTKRFKSWKREILSGKTRLDVQQAIGSFKPLLFSHLQKHTDRSLLIICKNQEEAEYLHTDLEVFTDHNYVFFMERFFPSQF